MIAAAYAQASNRQGVDAAIDGTAVDSHSEPFFTLRGQAIKLNLEATASRVDGVEVRRGRGLLRLQFDGNESEGVPDSPIVILVRELALDGDREAAVQAASASVAAIGRNIGPDVIHRGLSEASRVRTVSRRRRRINVALAVGVAAGIAVWAGWTWTPRDD